MCNIFTSKHITTYVVPSDRARSANPDAAFGKNWAIVPVLIVVAATTPPVRQ